MVTGKKPGKGIPARGTMIKPYNKCPCVCKIQKIALNGEESSHACMPKPHRHRAVPDDAKSD